MSTAADPVTQPIRVLWLVKGLGLGGTEQLLVRAVPHVDPARFTVEVAYLLPWKDALVSSLEEMQVPVHCLFGGTDLDLRWVWRLRRLVRARRFDLIHTHMPYPAVGARLVLGRGMPLVHTEHNVWERHRRATAWANALTLGRNRRVIAVSRGVAASVRPPRYVRSPPVEVVIHGIDPATVSTGRRARSAARAVLDLTPDDLVVGSVANFTDKKDQRSLLTAFGRVAAVRPNARLVLVGSGPLEHDLRVQVAEMGMADSVRFTGSRSDVLRLLPAFDVFALSSRYEGLPIALLEALAAGLPFVGTTAGGIPEVVTDGREGLLVAPGDVDGMASHLAQLLDDPKLRSRLGRAATARATQFQIGPAVRRTQALYDEALATVLDEGARSS